MARFKAASSFRDIFIAGSIESIRFNSIRVGGSVRFGFDLVHQNRIMQCAVHSVDFDVKCETDFIILPATYNTAI